MLVATVYYSGYLIIYFDVETVSFGDESFTLSLTAEDIMLVSGFLRDCANYYNGVKKEIKNYESICKIR